jgi:hypothetical protein
MAPDVVAGTVNTPTPAETKARNAYYDKQQAAQAAYAQSPQGMQAQADQQGYDVIGAQRKAQADQLQAEQDANTAQLNIQQKANERAVEQEKADAAVRADNQANVAKYTQQYADQIKAAADFHPDTNHDIGLRGMIAVALSGIGDALDHRHGPNAALELIHGTINARIADQWKQKEALGAKAAGTKGVLDTYLKNADNIQQAQDIQRAAMTKQVQDQVKLAVLQSANPQVRARGEMLDAQLGESVVAQTQNIVNRKQAALAAQAAAKVEQQKLGIEYGHLGESIRHNKVAERDARDEKSAQIAAEVLKLKDAGDQKHAEQLDKEKQELNDNGFMTPSIVKDEKGQVVTDPDGTPKVQYDYMRQAPEPGETIGKYYKAPKEAQKDLREADEGTREYVTALDHLQNLIDENGGDFNKWGSDARSKAQAVEEALFAKHKALAISGFRPGTGEMIEKTITGGGDPTSLLSSIAPQIEHARQTALDDRNQKFASHNYTGPPLDIPRVAPSKTRSEAENDLGELRTPLPGGVSSLVPDITKPESIARAESAREAGINIDKKQKLDTYGAYLQSTDPKTQKLGRQLLEGVLEAKDVPADVRKYARGILGANLAQDLKK